MSGEVYLYVFSIAAKTRFYDPQFEHDAAASALLSTSPAANRTRSSGKSLQVLINLQHRGAKGCEANTGDGAGILLQIPHEFLKAECKKLGFDLPAPGNYGVGMVCLPRDPHSQRWCKEIVEAAVTRAGQNVARLARCPDQQRTDRRLRESRRARLQAGFRRAQPVSVRPSTNFERKLYLIRKRIEKNARLETVFLRQFFGAARSSIKECFRPIRSKSTFPTWSIRVSSPRLPWFTSDSARTRFRAGRWRIRSATFRTTAKSTRCAATSTG